MQKPEWHLNNHQLEIGDKNEPECYNIEESYFNHTAETHSSDLRAPHNVKKPPSLPSNSC